jgi:hypothetical protein
LEKLKIPGIALSNNDGDQQQDQSVALEIDSAIFLPLLKKLKTNSCLGIY